MAMARRTPSASVGSVRIRADGLLLDGLLTLPDGATGVVLFAHGSGSSRLSPRNRYVADGLHELGIGTLLFDLLTEIEAEDRRLVFDVSLLARRLCAATDWLRQQASSADLGVGYFGASTGAAAALLAAAADPAIEAVVSRGGRPDLAAASLPVVRAPTLLIVGGDDVTVLELNQAAYARLRCEKRLEVVPGATHLFEEPGALDQVMRLAGDWFVRHLHRPNVAVKRGVR